ncbi:uncharacterized protein [Acropora muricata]
MAYAACGVGGRKTNISGHLDFKRGAKPHEVQCEWSIDLSSDHIVLMLPSYENQGNCGNPEVKVKKPSGEEVLHMQRCRDHDTVIKLIHSSSINLTVKMSGKFNSPRFVASYVGVSGGLRAATLRSSWIPTTTNITHNSFAVQWPLLTNQINQTVSAYVVLANWTTVYGGHQMTGKIVPLNATSATIRQIPSFRSYQVIVVAVDASGRPFNSSAVYVSTLEGVPRVGPWIEKYNLSSNGSVQIYWHALSERDRNGIILGYTIFYETLCKYHIIPFRLHYGMVNVSALSNDYVMNYTLNELRPGFEYSVRISAFTSKGRGPKSSRKNVWPACAGQRVLTESNGTILSPNFPCQYGGKHHCHWLVRPTASVGAIWIKVSDFRLKIDRDADQCWSSDLVAVSTVESKTGTLLCGRMEDFSVLVPADQVHISFFARRKNEWDRGDGFKAWYLGVNEEPTEISLLSWNLSVNVTRGLAHLSWSDFPLRVSIESFSVKYTDVYTNVSIYRRLERSHQRTYYLERGVRPDREFMFQIIATAKNATYSSIKVSKTTPEGAPALAPESVRVRNADTSGSIIVKWDPPSEESTNGPLRGYTVYYREQYYYYHHDDRYLGQSTNTSASTRTIVLRNLDGGKKYEISVAAFNLYLGSRSEWQRFIVGCGGSFNNLFGDFNLVKYDSQEINCSWKISNYGLQDAVMLISAHMVNFKSCSEYSKIVSSSGSQIFHYSRCRYRYSNGDGLVGELVEVPFNGSSFLTAKVKLYYKGSVVRSEFAILKAGKGLDSATSLSNSWTVSGQTSSSSSVIVTWSGFPNNLNAAYFIISLNQTPSYVHHYNNYKHYKPRVFLHMVHFNHSSAEVKGLSMCTEYSATVFLVDTTFGIYNSQTIRVQTGEGYPTHPPRSFRLEFISADTLNLKWDSIPVEHHNGRVIGYTIWYRAGCEHNYMFPGVRINVSVSTTSYTLTGLQPGTKYDLRIAGFTAAGIGHYERRDFFTNCAGPLSLTDSNATIQSPGYPCHYGGIQRCRWSITPGGPTSAIWIFFEEFSLSFYNYEFPYCSANDRVGISEGPSQNEVFFCSHMEGVFVLVRGEQANISFTGTRGWQRQGFKAWYIAEQTAITESPLPSWTISSSGVTSTSVNIEWSEFPMSLHSAQHMALMVTEPNREMFVFVRVHKWQRSRHIGNLSPNRVYLFKVVVFTGLNPNNVTYASRNISLRTNPGAPGCPPTNIRLETVQSTNLLVRWDGLPQGCENGQLGGYKVYYKKSYKYYWGVANHVTAGPSDTQVMITGLNQLEEYSVWITAFTSKEGPKSQSQSTVIGCGGSFNQTFGMMNLTKFDSKDQICSWDMYNVGLTNAVLLISIHKLRFQYCSNEYFRIFSNNHEFASYRGCSLVRGDLVMAPFGQSNNITTEIRIQSFKGYMMTTFVVLKGGLDSAVSPSASWHIRSTNKSDSSLTIDWSGFPVNLVASFFIISLNETPRASLQNKPIELLSIEANSSRTDKVVSGLPVFTSFEATVYLVDIYNDIYKSSPTSVETEGSVPTEAPYMHSWTANMAENSIRFVISPIAERFHRGKLLGYQITYFQFGREDNKTVIQVNSSTETVTLSSIVNGKTYLVFIAGFTSRGIGPTSHYAATLCGGDLQTQTGQFASPNYPHTPYFAPYQSHISPRCHWKLRPQFSNVSVIWLTFRNFFLGKRRSAGYCSGGAVISITGESKHVCGKQTNSSFLILEKAADIRAWGFNYHSEEFRENNGTKFLADFTAFPEESFLGQTIHLWTGVHFNATNWTALMTWPEPPSGFVRFDNVDNYMLIVGKPPTKIFYVMLLPYSGREFLISGLEALSNYSGKIIAVLNDGRRGSTDWVGFQTKEGIPSRNPYIIRIESVDYNSIWLRWSRLSREETRGTLRGYRIHISQFSYYYGSQPFQREITVGPNVTAYNVTGLPADTFFHVWVAGFTAVGEGVQRNERWMKTKCGSALRNNPGVLQSRGYPERMESADCVWYISSRNKTVFIWIEHYDIPYSFQCNSAYLAIGDASGIPPYRQCGVSGQSFALAQAPRVTLIYNNGGGVQGYRKGFKLNYFVMNVSFAEASLVTDWNIMNISDVSARAMHIEWSLYSPRSPYHVVVYSIVCTPTNGEFGSTVFNVNDTNVRKADVGRLHLGTNYSVELVAFVKNTQTGGFCLRRSQKAYFETLDGVPQEPPRWIHAGVHINITLNIFVRWPAIPNHKVEGRLLGYKVFYRVGDGEFSSKTVGPDVHETRINIANVPEPYEIRVAGFTNGGVGPMSWPQQIASCRSRAVSQMGVINNPGFPQSTPGGLSCFTLFHPLEFLISSVRRFRLVHLVDLLTNREAEGAPNCSYWQDDHLDWVLIHPKVILAGPFCGRVQPFAFISWGSFSLPILMEFFTGIGNHDRAFNSTFFVLYDFSKINLSLLSSSGHDAQLIWSVSNVGEQVRGYVVLYKPNKDRRAVWSFKRTLQQSQATLAPLQPLSNYTTWVLCYTASGKVYGSNTIHFGTREELATPPVGNSPTPPPVIRMYPCGRSAGDTKLAFTNRCPGIKIPRGGMRFFSSRFQKLYICPYGTIQFDRDRFNQRPYNFGQRYWLRFSSMIAPYWTRTDLGRSFTDGPSEVFYHIYSGRNDAEFLKNVTSDVLRSTASASLPKGKTFHATWVLVVTWMNLRHFELNPITEKLTNTFQAVIVTDSIFSFVMFNYPHNGIQFSAPTSVSLYEYFTNYNGLPVIGYNSGGSENHFRNILRSGTVQAEGIDNQMGNVNIPGRWIIRIENSNGIEDSDFNCSIWYHEQPDPDSFSNSPDPCPCTVFQAVADNRYTWVEPFFPYTECFYTVGSVSGRGRRCCYYKDPQRNGALILNSRPIAGTIDRYHRLQFPAMHKKYDVEGFGYCCLTSRRRVESCKKYYQKRPSEGCDAYIPPRRAPVFGDPHVITLDGRNYTFNGLGEYTLINVNDNFFELQARTKIARGGGTATVFSGAVAKENNTSIVQCNLKEEGGLEVLVDGQIFQEFFNLTNVSVILNDSVAVSRPQGNSFLVTFPSGISVTVTDIQGALSIVFAAPLPFQGQTKGLLGTWNDDQEDDFLTLDGNILPSNATGRQIHFNFGLKWQLLDNTTLFTYKPGESTSTFSNASFVPIFLDEPIHFASNELRTAAELACQGDVNCLFDIASTGDVTVGESTKQVSVQLESEAQALKNFPPKILVGPTEVNVTVNTFARISITAQDPNNDSLSFSVAGDLPAGYTTASNQTAFTLSWIVTTAQIEVEFCVSDGTANTVHSPVINVCACHNQGACIGQSSDDRSTNNNTQNFNILTCQCLNGYTGAFCEQDLDACEENSQPCFPGVSCIDLPPPANESGYTCAPCPNGFSGNGAECSDIDECAASNGGCNQICLNTPGSSVCTCNSGYSLNIDKKTCQDVDECQPTNDCMQVCENTVGSYNCKCNADFEVDPSDSKNCIPANPCQGNQLGCQHICFQSNGQEKCFCNAGYSLNQDGKTCSDIDECASSPSPCDQGCSNSAGSYTCSCVSGFKLDSNRKTCNDIDECLEFTFQCQDESQKCKNTHGSYKCVCDEGLYWIDNKCQGLEKGEAPPPPPPASEPKTPLEEERVESVNLDIQGLNTSEWNKPKEDAFKQSVAEAATKHCAINGNCTSSRTKRMRRSASNPIFTEDQVHLLPGYPKQVSQIPLVAVIAFYLQSPLGSSIAVVTKDVVVEIVRYSMADISSAINANITNVRQLFADTTTAPSTATTIASSTSSLLTTAQDVKKENSKTIMYIIVAVASVVVFVIVVALFVWCFCKGKERSQKVNSELSLRDVKKKSTCDFEMENMKHADNVGYHNDAYMLSPKARPDGRISCSVIEDGN